MAESNYILGQVIARGGMAEVYRGLHVGQDGFKRLVAIKRILPQFSSHKEFADMFRDEADIGQRLQHVNVVKVECYDVIEGLPSIVMEFVDGSDLRSVLAEVEKSREVRRVPIPMALYIVAEAARGLHYAHIRKDDVSGRALDLVHRDISPQNLLISFNGEVKVTDFGIAAADRDFKNTETRAGIVKGKYSYMSPEQISAKKVDARTDVFALSIVLWEMLAMRRLFSADSEVDVIDQVKNCRIPGRLREFNKDVSEELELIVMRGLAKDPNKRFGSMDELERALRSHISKHYQNFNVGDLGNFIKQVLANKHDASQAEIKKMLTSTNLRPGAKSAPIALNLDAFSANQSTSGDLTISRRSSGIQNTKNQNSGYSMRSSQPARPLHSNIEHKKTRQKKTPLNQKAILWAAGILLFLAGSLMVKNRTANSAKDALSFIVRSSPSNVKVKINGQFFNNGKFLTTPSKVKLELGPNIIEVSRSGYQSETLSIDTSKNEHRTMQPVVRLNPRGNFALTRFMLAGNNVVQVNINDGFVVNSLAPTKPVFEVRDLIDGSMAEAVVSEKGKPSYKCKLPISRPGDRKPIIVTIDPDRNACIIRSPSKERFEK